MNTRDTERIEQELEDVERIIADDNSGFTPEGRANVLGMRKALLFALGRVDSLAIGSGIID